MSNAPENAIEVTVDLRWSDQDMFGHVNNARIMTTIEEARVRTMRWLLQKNGQVPELPVFVVRKTETEFFLPLMYPDPLLIRVWVSRVGNTSFVLHHEVSQNSRICVTCEAVLVIFSVKEQSAIPIPSDTREALLEIAA